MNRSLSPLRIAIAHAARESRERFQELLPPLGHEIVVLAQTAQELLDRCREARPDLVIVAPGLPDQDGVEAAAAVARERSLPIILTIAEADEDSLAGAAAEVVMGILVAPLRPADVSAAIRLAVARFEHIQKLLKEVASLKQAMEDRKVIERAKGILMKRARVDEPEAFRRLQRLASDKNRKLIEIAQMILLAEEAFQAS